MATSSINQIKGLSTFPNYIGGENGADQIIASNVVIDRDNVLEPRRGMKVLTDLPEQAKQLLNYKDRVLTHYGNSLAYLSSTDPGYSTPFKGSANFSINSSTTDIRIIDHGLSIGDGVFFSKTRDYSAPNAYFTLPTGIDEVSQYIVYNVVNKDVFTISTSLVGAPIVLSGSNTKATVVFDYAINEVKDKLRIKFIELNSNLFFTARDGIKKVSQLSSYSIGNAGGIQALNAELSLAFSGSGGFFGSQTDDVEVAYRVVWGTKDVNNNLLLGKASERAFIQNYTRQNTDVVVSFVVPSGITTSYFYQIYRTNVFTIDGSGDEMRLVIEAPYDGYSTTINVTDATPEVIRNTGTPLYSNELSGEGVLQSNDKPPVCEDICVYKDRAWFANTKSTHKLDITFLGFDGFRDPIDAPVAVGNPATITLGLNHGVVVGDYIALANTTSVDGQYIVTAITSTTVTINANSALFGPNYVVYRSYITIAKGTQINRYFFVGKPEVTDIVTKQYGARETTKIAINNPAPFFNTMGVAKYFTLNTTSGNHYFYFVVTSETDPAVIGATGHAINLLVGDAINTVAAKTQIAISNVFTDFTANLFTNEVTVENIASGVVTDATAATSNATVTVLIQGTAGVVSSEYFNLTSIDDKIKYSFWFKKTINDVAPVVSGRVLFAVDLTTLSHLADADEVRAKVKESIDLTGDFFCVSGINPGEMTIATITVGAVVDAVSATQVGTSLVSIVKSQDGFGENLALGFARLSSYASPAAAIEDTAKSLVRLIVSTFESPVYAYYLASLSSLPGQFYLEERSFSEIPFTVTATGFQNDVSFSIPLSSTVSATNNIGNNVLMFSKIQQPESVPTVNSFRIGPQDKAIKRILGLRDSLFIFKEEGVYRLTGENESTFNIAFFDNSATIIAPDSAVILNNQIYCLTTQGVSTVSETGVGIISRQIENIFNTVTSENYINYATSTFGVSYEADRAYILFTVSSEEDTSATVAYRFNSFTRTWTSFDKSAICGIVSIKNKLHLGNDDINSVEIERKKLNSRDYVDRQYPRTISALSDKRVYIDNASDIKIGDSLTQTQYLSVDEFNNLIGRLKIDPLLLFSQTFDTLTTLGGADFVDAMSDLIVELNIKDTSRVVQNFTATASNVITIPTHGFEENDIVNFVSFTPIALTSGENYRVVNVTANTLQLTNLEPNTLIRLPGTIGLGNFNISNKNLNFNLIRDIDYVTYEILFPEHGLVDGNIITYTNLTTPVTAVPPTGLVNNRTYKVINSTSNTFRVVEVFLNLNVSENGTLTEVYYYNNTLDNKEIQKQFNQVVTSLNFSNGAFFTNYDLSIGSEELDMIVIAVELSQNYVNIKHASPFYTGDVTHYKSIVSEIMWDYFTLGEPSMLKHVSDGTVMIENNSLDKLTVGYASDLSGDFENVIFSLDGDGAFGKASFGETAFGGNGTAYPLRTLIPRQKQRCRHIRCRVYHDSSWAKFSVLGISYKFEVTSDRAYRR